MVRTGGACPGAGPGEGKEWEEEGSRARPDFQSGPGTCGATPDAGTVVEGGSMGRMRKRSCVASPGSGPWAGWTLGGSLPSSHSSLLVLSPTLGCWAAPSHWLWRTGGHGFVRQRLGSPDKFKFHINRPSPFVDVCPEECLHASFIRSSNFTGCPVFYLLQLAALRSENVNS